jgi:hypothetical protein
MATERIGNLGYFGMVKEVTPGIALTPNDYVPFYDQTFNTQMNFVDIDPIYGNKFQTFATLQGLRDHKGDVTLLAEPNTSARMFDALLTRTSTSGSAGLFTHVFQLTGDSNSYTWDFSTGNIVMRYYGVKASKIAQVWNKTELQWKVSASALGSFLGRQIASVPTGAGPYTVVLDTAYDPNPTTGLVMGDLIRFYKATGGTTIDATVATIVDGKTITTTTDVTTLGIGDSVYLRPATTVFNLLPSFIWPKTQFQFGATAAAALTNPQLRVESGSNYEVDHYFESDSGSARSGGFDPASLVRTTGDVMLNVKKFFDTPDDIANWNKLTKTAAVVRHFSGTTNQYEARVTFNHLTTDGVITPDLKSKTVSYSDIKYHTDYDLTDAQGYQVTIVNALATI